MTRKFSLKNLSGRNIALAVVAVTLAAALLWWYYLYQPTQTRIAQLESDIARLDTEIMRGEAARANLPALQETVARLEQERLNFLAQLPRESEIAELIVQLQEAARRTGVVLEGLNRAGGVQSDITGVRPIDFTLSAGGTYAALMAFLQELEALQRFTSITQVGLSLVDDEAVDPELNSNVSFTAYVFVGEDPGAQPPGAQN